MTAVLDHPPSIVSLVLQFLHGRCKAVWCSDASATVCLLWGHGSEYNRVRFLSYLLSLVGSALLMHVVTCASVTSGRSRVRWAPVYFIRASLGMQVRIGPLHDFQLSIAFDIASICSPTPSALTHGEAAPRHSLSFTLAKANRMEQGRYRQIIPSQGVRPRQSTPNLHHATTGLGPQQYTLSLIHI